MLRASLEEVRKLGFDHLKQIFLVATQAIKGRGEMEKVRKIEIVRKWGYQCGSKVQPLV